MSSARDFPISFSTEVRAVLGSPDVYNQLIRAGFPQLLDGWANRSSTAATPFQDGLRGSGMTMRIGAWVPQGTAMAIFGGTVYLGSCPRGRFTIPMPRRSLHGVDMSFMVDGSARAGRYASASDAVLISHSCTAANLVGEWWYVQGFPYLVARTSRHLASGEELLWNFDLHGEPGYTMSHEEARLLRRTGAQATRCRCAAPYDCPLDRYVRVGNYLGAPSDWAAADDWAP
jgi:hypothetical protein